MTAVGPNTGAIGEEAKAHMRRISSAKRFYFVGKVRSLNSPHLTSFQTPVRPQAPEHFQLMCVSTRSPVSNEESIWCTEQ